MNKLFYGDNLDILRNKIRDESADLIYLDPPFKSDANYNVFFQSNSTNSEADAQVEAFKDTWKWGDAAETAYDDVRNHGKLGLALSGIRRWLGDQNAMMAYLAMMAVRFVELQRVLKPTGSIYLHCDPTASHYLKILLDATFGHDWFRNEIIWKRTNSRSTVGQWPRLHDTLLMYSSPESATFSAQRILGEAAKLPHTLITGSDGMKYQTYELTGAGITKQGESGQPWRGFNPTKMGRHWGYSSIQMEAWDLAGLIHWPKNGGWPRRRAEKPFDASQRQVVVGDVWTDIDRLNQTAKERLGYPTQKPLALLERVLVASSREGDVVLDPFCGCGTAVDAAEKLHRQWIGIDVAHYAVTLIEERLARWRAGAVYEVYGRPTTLDGARELAHRDKHQFQWWAAWLLGAQSYQRDEKKGADQGIDGRVAYKNGPYGDGQIIISVKGGEHIGVQMVRDLRGVVEREEAEMGILVCLATPTGPMLTEAARAGFVPRSAHGRLPRLQVITIEDILDGRPPRMPPIPQPERHTPVRRKTSRDQLELLLPHTGDAQVQIRGEFIDPRFMKFGRDKKQSLVSSDR
ncbi:Modification methylase EcaI [Mesorhizobium plurifarium]|uniref:site-specific DNA-methyltransferase (adenine-specific) n=1 Tax=Mesorhizobium plurifarium TaxID=69974 RepID=A0A090FVH4_MESPL|nr:Modification methylase EcaI [Mesorhizobium plurifarium]